MDGLCPADRFFSIQKEKRAAIERGVAANVEALARHGKVQQPLYMVGRVGEKTLVITTQDKRMSVQVDGQEISADHPLVYDLKKGANHEGTGDHNIGAPAAHTDVQCEGKEPGGAVALERAAQRGVADEGDGCAVGVAEPLGEARPGRDAERARPDLAAGHQSSSLPTRVERLLQQTLEPAAATPAEAT